MGLLNYEEYVLPLHKCVGERNKKNIYLVFMLRFMSREINVRVLN